MNSLMEVEVGSFDVDFASIKFSVVHNKFMRQTEPIMRWQKALAISDLKFNTSPHSIWHLWKFADLIHHHPTSKDMSNCFYFAWFLVFVFFFFCLFAWHCVHNHTMLFPRFNESQPAWIDEASHSAITKLSTSAKRTPNTVNLCSLWHPFLLLARALHCRTFRASQVRNSIRIQYLNQPPILGADTFLLHLYTYYVSICSPLCPCSTSSFPSSLSLFFIFSQHSSTFGFMRQQNVSRFASVLHSRYTNTHLVNLLCTVKTGRCLHRQTQ